MVEKKKKVLIIDDEPDTVTYFSSLLEDNGYETIVAKDGEEGLNKTKTDRPDLITLDISMPEKSGVKLYRELRTSDDLKQIPIIIITGVSEDFRSFISSRRQVPPPDGYITKPIDQDEFLDLVKKLV